MPSKGKQRTIIAKKIHLTFFTQIISQMSRLTQMTQMSLMTQRTQMTKMYVKCDGRYIPIVMVRPVDSSLLTKV